MSKYICRMFCLLLIMLVSTTVIAKKREYYGIAYALDSDKVLYKEFHVERYNRERPYYFTVTYRDDAGKAFAKKTVIFKNTIYDPDIELIDYRYGYLEKSEYLGQGKYRLSRKGCNDCVVESREVTPKGTVVIDNGFDFLVRDKMSELTKGEKARIVFIAPAALDYFSFRIVPIDIQKQQIRLRTESDFALFRLFTDPIFAVYEVNSKRLIEYEGLTNVPKLADKNHVARIKMFYES